MNAWFTAHREGDTAHVSIFGELGTFGISAERLLSAVGDAAKLDVVLNSPGGDSRCGLALCELFAERETTLTVTGLCGSAAAVGACGAKKILAYPTARFLIHSPVNLCVGTPKQLRREADELEKIVVEVRDAIARRTKQPKRVVNRWLSKDTWFDAAQAMEAGLLDGVVDAPRVIAPAKIRRRGEAVAPAAMEAEALFFEFLAAFGPLEVGNREAFGRQLGWWFSSVKEKI